jgi:Tfp pilus assembly protein PilV
VKATCRHASCPWPEAADKGFTLVELLIAAALSIVGFLALLYVQTQTLAGLSTSKSLVEASNLAEHFLETLREESIEWTNMSTAGPNQDKFLYLKAAPTSTGAGTTSGWIRAYTAPSGQEQWIGKLGADTTTYDIGIQQQVPWDRSRKFCAHYRLTWLIPELLLRAEVRVMWPREGADYAKYSTCPTDQSMEDDLMNVASVSMSTALMRNIFVEL